jgi:hypothetical protein
MPTTSSSAKLFVVHARWDEESRTWWTDGEDVPGLTCQAATFDELAETVFDLAPELVKINGAAPPGRTIEVKLVAERRKTTKLVA